ncbi:MAG: hypothetical protein CTY15_14830 [Methylocystis sp.]|nr:MAG: hypothetical protein CTY15_14830 [Methylocystis sp.]
MLRWRVRSRRAFVVPSISVSRHRRAPRRAHLPSILKGAAMGWLYMQSLGGHAGPRDYLDAQFTFENAEGRSRVLRSALLGDTYYAAVEQQRRNGGESAVFALVCLTDYNPRDVEGFVFGYKDMTEHMGPCESDCPEDMLDLLTPTDRPYAIAWRARCRGTLRRGAGRPHKNRHRHPDGLATASPLR